MRPEEFTEFKRRMEERGIRVRNTTPKDPAEEGNVRGEVFASPRRQFRAWYTARREAEREEESDDERH